MLWMRLVFIPQSDAEWCSVLQCGAVYCSVLQCFAVRYSVVDAPLAVFRNSTQRDAVRCSVLQCVAVCCRVLQCVAACCSVSQCCWCTSALFRNNHSTYHSTQETGSSAGMQPPSPTGCHTSTSTCRRQKSLPKAVERNSPTFTLWRCGKKQPHLHTYFRKALLKIALHRRQIVESTLHYLALSIVATPPKHTKSSQISQYLAVQIEIEILVSFVFVPRDLSVWIW